MPRRVPDEYVLLCERCGYEIEGLPAEANCPECGKPARESLPSRRTGTPWQRLALTSQFVSKCLETIRRPSTTFAIAMISTKRTNSLSAILFVASALPGLALWIELVLSLRRTDGNFFVSAIGAGVFCVLIATMAFFTLRVLTWIEERGIRFWGPRRGWRITPAIAKVICAHASVGWLVGSVLAVVGHALGWVLSDMTNHANYGVLRGPMQLAPISLPAIALIAGMLHFEILVYIGMTRMKFANRPRPAPLDASMPPASMPSTPSSEA